MSVTARIKLCALFAAACEWGKYGQDCSESCGHCRYNSACDVVSGACNSCVAGFQLPLCKTGSLSLCWFNFVVVYVSRFSSIYVFGTVLMQCPVISSLYFINYYAEYFSFFEII